MSSNNKEEIETTCSTVQQWRISTDIHWFSVWFIRLPNKNRSLAVWL